MILPLTIDYPYMRRPIATISLIGANVFFFILMLGMSNEVLGQLMLYPDRFAPWQWWTSGFLHGGPLHLAGNMLFLWVYGRYVEERVGPWRFLALYAALAPVESLAFVVLNYGSGIPALGASGVISGLMGVVMASAPRSRVKTLLWFGPIVRVIPIYAGLILGFWVFQQVMMAMIGAEGIAISSHLGGFAGGLVAGVILTRYVSKDSPWSIAIDEQSREDLREKRDAAMWSSIASYHRGKRDHVGSGKVPDWLATPKQSQVVDPYEQEQLERWNAR